MLRCLSLVGVAAFAVAALALASSSKSGRRTIRNKQAAEDGLRDRMIPELEVVAQPFHLRFSLN
jgi:hypothetical protein